MTTLYRGKAIRSLVDQVAAMVTEERGFDNQTQVGIACRDTEVAPKSNSVQDDDDDGRDIALRCRW